MPRVALVGAAISQPPQIDPDTEVWTVGRLALSLPRVDRAYEVHTKKVYESYLKTLKTAVQAGVKLYMREPIDGALMLPLQFLRELTGGFFRSTPAFMVAHAVLDLYDEIELHGLHMGGDEYRDQRPSFLYHLGFAKSRGVKIFDYSHLIDWGADYGIDG